MSGILNSIYNNSSYALYLHGKAIAQLQEQYSTGSRINRPSDDPSGAYEVLGLKSQAKTLDNFMKTIDDVSSVLKLSTTAIGQMVTELADTKANITQVISGSYSESGRQILADKVNASLEKMLSLANTKHAEQYIYGGNDTQSVPYIAEKDSRGYITKVTYQGSDEERTIEVGPGVESSAYQAGSDLFQTNARSTPEFSGTTGAAVGTGTASVKGTVWLNVTNDGTDYNLSIGGPTVDLGTVGDLSNVAVKDADGNVLYVDARNINGTGYSMVTVPGTYDIFNTLISIRDLLLNKNNLNETQLAECRNNLSDSLDEVKTHLLGKETSIGSKEGFIDDLKTSLENIKNNAEDEATSIEQSDIAQVSIDLARRQTLYQMTLAATGKLMSMSLLDYL